MYFLQAFLSSADFFQNQLFRNILSKIPSECKIVLIQIRPEKISGLIWFQTVCKRLSADDTSKQIVKYIRLFFIPLCFDFINEPKQRSKPPQPSRYCFLHLSCSTLVSDYRNYLLHLFSSCELLSFTPVCLCCVVFYTCL